MADYYVATDGSGDLTTVNQVNSLSLSAGDRVFFRRGDTWRSQRLSIDAGEGGTESSPITIGAYGSGDAPIISGAVLLSNWVASGSNWYTEDLSSSPEAVYDNDRFMTEVSLIGDVLPGKWFWDSVNSRVYLRTFEDDTPANHTIDASDTYQAIYCQGDWIKFENLFLEKGHQACVEISTSSADCSFTNCTFSNGAQYGIWVLGTRLTLNGCDATDNQSHGVYVSGSSATGFYCDTIFSYENYGDGIQLNAVPGFEIVGGVSQYNASDGLAVVSCPGGTLTQQISGGFQAIGNGATGILISASGPVDVDGVQTYSNTTHGVELASTSTDVTIERLQSNANGSAGVKVGAGTEDLLLDYSICYDNDIGVDYTSDPGTGNRLYNLVLYDNDSTGIDLTGSAAAVQVVTIRNVIMSDTPVGMDFDTNATTNTHTITNNCYYACSTAAVDYDGSTYTVAQIHDGTYYDEIGYDEGSIGQSPQFTDPPNDFRPEATSPCLNAAYSVSLTLDFYGTTVPIQLIPDIGAAEVFAEEEPPEPPGPPPGMTVEERLAAALGDLSAAQFDLVEAAGILVQGGTALGFPEALGHVRTGQEYVGEAIHRLGPGGPEPPPPPPPPPPPIEPPLPPPRTLPNMQARTADLLNWVPGVGAWSGWAVTPEGVATIDQGGSGQIKGKGAQAVRAMPRVTYWARATFEVKIERTMLTRPDTDTVLFSLASYGGRFVPRNRIVPNIPLDPNPYVNLAPLLGDLAEESLSLRLVAPESDGLSLRLENVLESRRRVETIEIREDDALQPGCWTKIELLVGMSSRDTIYGTVRFADMASGGGVLGEVHEFETWLLNDTATPFVWAWCGPLEVPSSGWVEYQNIELSSTPWERG